MGGPGGAGHAQQGASGMGIPVGCAQSRKGGYEINATVRFKAGRECCGLLGRINKTESVSQPLYAGARHEDRALEGVSSFSIEAVTYSRQQTVARFVGFAPRVQHRKTAGAVGAFEHAGLKAALTHQRSLLIAHQCAHPDGGPKYLRVRSTEVIGGIQNLRQDRFRDIEVSQ